VNFAIDRINGLRSLHSATKARNTNKDVLRKDAPKGDAYRPITAAQGGGMIS